MNLKDIVKDVIKKSAVNEALDILNTSGNEAITEFLKYYIEDKLNICCLVIDKYADLSEKKYKHFGGFITFL